MNNFQNNPKISKADIIKWGSIPAIIIVIALAGIILTRSSETSSGFLVKWKSAMESGNLENYDALWAKNAREQIDSGYQDTARLFAENFVIDVNIANAVDRTRKVAQYPNYLQIEEIPLLIHAIGEPETPIQNIDYS